jgi:hypothetical protein
LLKGSRASSAVQAKLRSSNLSRKTGIPMP